MEDITLDTIGKPVRGEAFRYTRLFRHAVLVAIPVSVTAVASASETPGQEHAVIEMLLAGASRE